MMTRAYNITYLEDAMASVGAMLDYAVNSCGESLTLFYARFLGSGIASEIFLSNPKYIAGMSGAELAMEVARRTGDELPSNGSFIDIGSPEYWTGWTLTYLSWFLNVDFGVLQSRGVDIQSLYDRYPSLHEADLSKAVSFAQKRLQQHSRQYNPLKQARLNAGLTQKELAELSGNPIRNIRAYEQGQRALDNAGAESVQNLSKALGCQTRVII